MCLIPEPICFPLPQLLLSAQWLSLHFAIEAFPLLDHVNYFSCSIPGYLVLFLATPQLTKITRIMTAIISVVLTVCQALFQVQDRYVERDDRVLDRYLYR